MLQVGAGLPRLGSVMRFVSKSVMTGFVDALAVIYLLPRVTKAVPSPLVCIVVLTALSLALGLDLRTVGGTAADGRGRAHR